MGYFIFTFLPVYQTPLSVIRFHEFRSIGEGSRREKIATGTSPLKNHLTRTTRRKAARRNVASWWHIGGEREREGKKKKHFPRVPFPSGELFSRGVIRFWSIEVASFFRFSSDGKCVSADPDPGRRGGTKRRGKNGETLHHWWNIQRIIIIIEKFAVTRYALPGKFSNRRKYSRSIEYRNLLRISLHRYFFVFSKIRATNMYHIFYIYADRFLKLHLSNTYLKRIILYNYKKRIF